MPELKTSEPLHVTEVSEANGWYTILTDGQPKKLKTNREEGGRAAGRHRINGDLIEIQFSERSSGNINPHTNAPYPPDIYWYAAKLAEAPPSTNGSDDGITRVKATAAEKTPAEAWRIALSVGTERAVQLAPHLPQAQATFPFIWALSYEFASRIFLTPPPAPDSLEPLPLADDTDEIPY